MKHTTTVVSLALMPAAAQGAAQPCHWAVDSFFTNPDPFIQNTCIPNIEKYRRGDVALKFVGSDGSALTGLQVAGKHE